MSHWSPRAVEAAEGARALDVAVGQPAVVVHRVELLLHGAVDVAPLPVAQEQVVGHVPVVLRIGVGVQVEGQAEAQEALDEAAVVALDHLGRADALLVGAQGDGGAVGVRAGDHQHLVARQAMIAREDIGRQIRARQVADVAVAGRIGPGDADVDILGHGKRS